MAGSIETTYRAERLHWPQRDYRHQRADDRRVSRVLQRRNLGAIACADQAEAANGVGHKAVRGEMRVRTNKFARTIAETAISARTMMNTETAPRGNRTNSALTVFAALLSPARGLLCAISGKI